MKSDQHSRRQFVGRLAAGATALTALPLLGGQDGVARAGSSETGAASRIVPLDQGWLFGGELQPGALAVKFDDKAFEQITLPHCSTKLSWQNWDWEGWQKMFCYRRHFTPPPEFKGQRVFLDFEGVMVGAEPTVNDQVLQKHLGGYVPFSYEITERVLEGDNVIALALDARWSDTPPGGSPKGLRRVDYLEAGGIHRSVRLRAVPKVFIHDVFAKPVKVLADDRRLDVLCTIDAAARPAGPVQIQVELQDRGRVVSRGQKAIEIAALGKTEATLTLDGLGAISLWDVEKPYLYDVVTTLIIGDKPVHDYRVRTGFREARFTTDGFFLNGRRLQIFGLNRHEVYPYVGYAMPPRVKRHDAEILKRDFNCNFVRCSHYPQSPDFLDACDELGLLVWEEVPGWGYIGDDAWKDLLVRDTEAMIVRDRNRPSIVIWGSRANESANDVELYRRTKALARKLDDSRQTSGSMTSGSKKDWKENWHEDVFAYDDYHVAQDGTVGMDNPPGDVPYMFAEAVGQFNYLARKGFTSYYRRSGEPAAQMQQAIRHAQAHNKAAANPKICGVVAWCGFEYSSLVNEYKRVKYPGVADVFRIPKLGASFYLSQVSPQVRPVIQPNFYWDFGPQSPRGPGKHVAIFSNCNRLEIFINGEKNASLTPDKKNYGRLKYPPFFIDLDLDGAGHPELRIDGYVGDKMVLSRSFSSDPAQDQFVVDVADSELVADGADATRVAFRVVDKFGAPRAFGGGDVHFDISGPGTVVGDNPFALSESGGVGAIWIRTVYGQSGRVVLKARHSRLGEKGATVEVKGA